VNPPIHATTGGLVGELSKAVVRPGDAGSCGLGPRDRKRKVVAAEIAREHLSNCAGQARVVARIGRVGRGWYQRCERRVRFGAGIAVTRRVADRRHRAPEAIKKFASKGNEERVVKGRIDERV
jgi:hypothetical protein